MALTKQEVVERNAESNGFLKNQAQDTTEILLELIKCTSIALPRQTCDMAQPKGTIS